VIVAGLPRPAPVAPKKVIDISEHVERRQQRRDGGDDPEHRSAQERPEEDLVLTERARERRDAGNGERAGHHGEKGDRMYGLSAPMRACPARRPWRGSRRRSEESSALKKACVIR